MPPVEFDNVRSPMCSSAGPTGVIVGSGMRLKPHVPVDPPSELFPGVSLKLATPRTDFRPRTSIVLMTTPERAAWSASSVKNCETFPRIVPEVLLRIGSPPQIKTSDFRPGKSCKLSTTKLEVVKVINARKV